MKTFTAGQNLIAAMNPAENIMIPVTFIRWFDKGRTYARVRFEDGYKVSLPVHVLIAA